MRLLLHLFTYAIAAFMPVAQAQSFNPAMIELSIADPKGDRDLSGFIWYPTQVKGPLTSDFESKVWVGNQIVKNAEPSEGQFPLVVLSHGMYGNAYNQAWFAVALARQGYIVAAINHPGTSTWSREPEITRQLWERPKDVSRVIDHLTTESPMSELVDAGRIFMAGHSLGGFTAIALAGGRYDASRLKRFCSRTPDELVCTILSRWKIAQTFEDRAQMEADLSDSRIKAFTVFDLGGTQSFSDQSLAQIDRPLLIYGAPIMNSGLTLDIEARALRDAVTPGIAKYVEPETLSHFDFFGVCKPGGYELLAKDEPGDEIICEDGGAGRAAKHKQIIAEALNLFATH